MGERNIKNISVGIAKPNIEMIEHYTKLFYGGNRSEFVRAAITDKLEKCSRIVAMYHKIQDTKNPEYKKVELIVPEESLKFQDLTVYNK